MRVEKRKDRLSKHDHLVLAVYLKPRTAAKQLVHTATFWY